MKKMLKGLAAVALLASCGFASNYPVNYCDYKVTIYESGPAALATVMSACAETSYIIAYRPGRGYLFDDINNLPASVDAQVIMGIPAAPEARTMVTLGREWQKGKVFISRALKAYDLGNFNPNAYLTYVKMGFYANGREDTVYNQFYTFPGRQLAGRVFPFYGGSMPTEIWDFIVGSL